MADNNNWLLIIVEYDQYNWSTRSIRLLMPDCSTLIHLQMHSSKFARLLRVEGMSHRGLGAGTDQFVEFPYEPE